MRKQFCEIFIIRDVFEIVEIMRSEVEKWVGRELTASEARTIEWLSGWELETRANIMRLLRDANRAGRKR